MAAPSQARLRPEELTAAQSGERTEPGAAAETITGQNERTGSEAPAATSSAAEPMPAEGASALPPSGASAQPQEPLKPRPTSLERDRDLLDEVLEIGKLSLPKTRAIQEDFKPNGILRKAFTNQGGMGPDEALDALHRAGLYQGLESEDEFLDALRAVGPNRVRTRSLVAQQAEQLRVEAKQHEQFDSKVLRGQRPWREQGATVAVRVEDLLEGEEFSVQGHKFRVRDLEIDEDGRLLSLQVKDGPKFGVQRIEPNQEFIHIDRDSLKRTPAEQFLREEPPLFGAPETVEEQKARLAREQGEKKKAAEREQLAARAQQPLAGSRGDIGQRDLFGGGDLFSEEPGDPSLWHLPDAEILQRLDDPQHPNFVNVELEARQRGLIDRTGAEEDDLHRAQRERKANEEAAAEREEQRGELQRREQPGKAAGREPAGAREQTGQGATSGPAREIRSARPQAATKAERLEQAIAELESQRAQHKRQWESSVRQGNNIPATESAVNALSQMRYLDGQIDLLESELHKIRQATLPGQKDLFEHWLERMIEATNPLKHGLLEGVSGARVWMTKTLAHGAMKATLAAYRTGKKVWMAIDAGIEWLKAANIPDFSEREARAWLRRSEEHTSELQSRGP